MKQASTQYEKKIDARRQLPQFWLFDLDNTLYPADSDLFLQIADRMGSYISKILKVDRREARVLQKSYYMKYGTTLSGLIQNHGIDADAYLVSPEADHGDDDRVSYANSLTFAA